MLERIHKITGVGLFNDIRPAAIQFKKISLIYGDNGRGKSTLASIMRSYTHSASNVLLSRKTFNSSVDQFIDLQFSQGNRAKFENNQWDRKFTDFHVFDLDFIDTNVYSGGEITPGQRKNLLSFALGQSAVAAKIEFDAASQHATNCTTAKRNVEARLTGYRGHYTLSQYIRLRSIDNIDDLIAANLVEQGKSQRISVIKNKNKLKKLTEFTVDIQNFFNVMYTTVDKIDENASSVVDAHFQHLSDDGAQKWISDGQKFLKEDTCPFCAQTVEGLSLIDAYKTYFNTEYRNFIKEISLLENKKAAILSSFNIPLKNQEQISITENILSWGEYLSLNTPSLDINKLDELKTSLDGILTDCVKIKTASPLDKLEQKFEGECQAIIDKMVQCVTEFNEQLDILNNQIDDYKTSLENINIQTLTEENNRLNAIKTRYSPAVVNLINEYTAAKAVETAALAEKEAKKNTLNTIMQATLGRYESSINILLQKFGAAFTIEEVTYNYRGTGEPRTEYALNLRGNRITLQGEDAGFKTCLSEGDKRTLAFAFFIAVISEDQNLTNKIVLIDDPMCSFDTHRKQQTVNELKKICDNCKQLIILAHDAFFIKKLRDDFIKKLNDPNLLSLIKVVHTHGQFSTLVSLDLDIECESAYYKNHRLVSGYVNGEPYNEKDVATAIRPLLEGYLHRRFPNHIPSGKLFGEIVQAIVASQPGSPLHHASSITNELNEINSYAGKFHHDTNANAANEPIFPGELIAYCTRALNIIYSGSV